MERPTKLPERTHLPDLKRDVRGDASNMPEASRSPVQNYLQRKQEVTQRDHEQFSAYVQEKSARDQQQTAQPTDAPHTVPSPVNRRSLLKWAAGTAAAGEA